MRQRPDWKLVLAVGFCVAAIAANPKKNRTSPVGYEDTPVLPGQKWRVHDLKRPHPPVVTPGAQIGQPPSDAIVLFSGKDLSKWSEVRKDGKMGPAAWK